MSSPTPTTAEVLAANAAAKQRRSEVPTRRVNVTRDKLEDIAFQNRTQIVMSETDQTATTRVGVTEFWAELGPSW